jgi:hypothetical protein
MPRSVSSFLLHLVDRITDSHVAIAPSCMEHSMDVAAGHFVSAVGPKAARKVIRKVKAALRKAHASDQDLDLDQLDSDIATALGEDNSDDSANETDGPDFDIADTVGKALALVQQVRYVRLYPPPCLIDITINKDTEISTSSCLLQENLH